MAAEQLILGLDLGTTSVKGVLIEKDTCKILEEFSVPTAARCHSFVERGAEQDVSLIISALESLLPKFKTENLQKVKCLGVSGQMHGIVLWKNGAAHLHNGHIMTNCTSSLVTWQDGRCSNDFLLSLPQTHQRTPVVTGYGCATLFWYIKNGCDITIEYDKAGTIMDYVVYILCGSFGDVVMSSQNANSWGYFDIKIMKWEYEILEANGFPINFLPKVVSAPSIAGCLIDDWCGLPSGIPISVAMGDLQCSVSAVQPEETDAVLNIGSAIQMSFIMKFNSTVLAVPTLSQVPYFYDQTLLVAASLTGADIFARMVDLFKEFATGVGVSVNDEVIYSYLIQSAKEKINTTLQVKPLLFGERHCLTERGSVINICADNCSIGDISCAVMKGIASNLHNMTPSAIFQQFQIKKIISCGSTCYKNPLLVQLIKDEFKLPVLTNPNADAPLGAAIIVSSLL